MRQPRLRRNSTSMNKAEFNDSRILVISPNWIGDAIMAQPLLQRLKSRAPERAIDVLAPSWVAPVWRAMREVDTVIEAPFKHGALQLGERWKFARMLRRRGYGEAYVLPNTLKFALIPWLAGIARRIGYKGEMRYGLLNVMHHDNAASPRPMREFYAALADAPAPNLPAALSALEPEMFVADEQVAEVLTRLALPATGPLIVFAPGAEFGPAKRWPTAQFAALAGMIRQAHPDATIVLLGSGKDRPVCEEIATAVPGVRNLAGETALEQAIAIIAGATAMVTNDSGLMHVAAALRRPLVAVYGPTDPRHTPPHSVLAKVLWLHLDCAPCQQRECPLGHNNCMKNIAPEMVWTPLQHMLKSG